jgi:ribosomal protein S18 acetylase RimI-like enzyme
MKAPHERLELGKLPSEHEISRVRRIIDVKDLEQVYGAEMSKISGLAESIHERIMWGVYGNFGQVERVTEFRDVERLTSSVADATAFKELYLHGLENEPSNFGSTYEEVLTTKIKEIQQFLRNNHVAGVKYSYTDQDGKPTQKLVGIAALRQREGVQSHIADAGNLYVHPVHRIRGIAKNLGDYRYGKIAKQIGVEQVQIIVTTTNKFAIDFYKRLGFVEGRIEYRAAKLEKGSTIEYFDWLHMTLNISQFKGKGK